SGVQACALPISVAGCVDGDLVEPGREARFLLESTQSAVGLEECLLAEVAGLVMIPYEPVDDALDLAVPAANELIERGNVPGLEGHHQICVGQDHVSEGMGRGRCIRSLIPV